MSWGSTYLKVVLTYAVAAVTKFTKVYWCEWMGMGSRFEITADTHMYVVCTTMPFRAENYF